VATVRSLIYITGQAYVIITDTPGERETLRALLLLLLHAISELRYRIICSQPASLLSWYTSPARSGMSHERRRRFG